MTRPDNFLSGSQIPRPAKDSYTSGQYERLGLRSDPTLEEIEPFAKEMMQNKHIIEGMSLVLGRRIDSREIASDPALAEITQFALRDPETAYGGLLIMLTLEELEAER
jgi:hypothetical protein